MILRRTILLLCLAFVFSLCAISRAATPQVEVIAKTAKVKVREETIAVVKKGETYRVLKTQGAWVAISIGEGEKQKRGWILASAVKTVADPAITEDSPAPAEPAEVRVAIDLTQFTPMYGPQSAVYFKVSVSNEGVEPLDFKIADLELKVDDQPLPRMSLTPGAYLGYQVFTEPTGRMQVQSSTLPFLNDSTLAPGAVAEGWQAFNLGSLQQALFTPGSLAGKTWIVEGKVGTHKIRIDLKAAEMALIAEKARPSKLDDSVQVIEVGPRINALNASQVLDLLRSIPAGDRGCVLVLKNKECSFDGLATMQFQQQMFQIINSGNQPVVSNEGATPNIPWHPYQGFFSYGQIQIVASETAGVLTVLGRRADTGATLIKHLADESSDTRAAAARALTQHLAEPGVVEALAQVAADVEPNVRTAAVGALGGQQPKTGLRQSGSVDTVALINALTDSVPGVRMTAAHTAAVFPCDEVRAALIKLLDDMDITVKLASAGSLGTLQTRDAVPKLKELQSDANPQIKTAAIDALQKIGELTPLSAALAKLDGGLLQDADYIELGKARNAEAVPLLIARLQGNDNYQINLVGRTLGEIGDSRAVEPLIRIFVYGNRNFGMAELPRALGRLGDNRAVEPMRQALQVPNQNIQPDLRIAIFEGLLQLKAPQALEDASGELEKIAKNNRHFEASPLLLALGRSRDAKAIPIVEPFLTNPQTCQAAAEALCQLGTKAAFSALESRLSAANFPYSQMILANRKWPRSAASVTFLKRLVGSANQQTSNAALQALTNLQTNENSAPSSTVSAPIGYFAPVISPGIAPSKAIEAWVNGAAPTSAELRGKVLLILLPETTGVPPDLPAEGNKWLQKFEKQGLVVFALWKCAGWDWDPTAKGLVGKSDASGQQEQQTVAALAKARGIKFRVGLVSAASGLTEQFAGLPGTRLAIVDRAGILQAVRSVDEADIESSDIESLIAELLAEPVPSASTVRIPRQTPIPPAAPNQVQTAEPAGAASSFDPAAASWTIPAHDGTIWSAKFSPDGKSIATTGEEGTARLWDVATGKLRHTLSGHTGVVRHCAFTGDGSQLLTSGFDHTIRVWDAATGEPVKTLTDDAPVYYLSPLGDNRTVISASYDARLRFWSLVQGELEGYLAGHSATIWTAAAATVNGTSTIVSGSNDRTVRIWDFQSGETRHTLSGHLVGVNAVAISANAKLVASGAGDGEVIIWNATSGAEEFRISGTDSMVYDLAFSTDHKTLAVGRGNHTVSFYDAADGKLVRQLNRGGWCVHFSRDGKLLASGCDDRTLRIWKVRQDVKN